MVAIVTPMTVDGAVDYPALDRLLDFHLANGTDAIVAVGTTGESATLDYDEHCAVMKHCIEYIDGRLPVIAGTGSNSTSEAITLTLCAKELGADAALLVTPYYNKPTQEGLYLHYKAVAEAVDLPIILYNVPGRTAVDLLPETVARLSNVNNIIGIKDATGKLERLTEMRQNCHPGFEFYTGDDATAIDFILLGGQGSISVTANIAPLQLSKAYQAALAGDAQLAHQLDAPLRDCHRDLFIEANPIPVKWALYRMGLIEQGIRLPLTVLSPQHQATLEAALKKANLLA
jgi:4-hydroxy-tetrahydrodipicolinate synthase